MLESQGIFSLAARSEASVSLARNVALAQTHIRTTAAGGSGYLDLMTNTSISPAAKLKAFLKDVLDKTDDKLITDEMLNRLQKATKSDNKEISAQKLQQAKAKLQALRAQAQLAAATGDAKALRRLAQEVAAAAREIASAVRGLASGIAATAETADGSTSNSMPLGAASAPGTGSSEGSPADTDTSDATGEDDKSAYAGPVPEEQNPLAWGRQALNKLSSDAHLAIAQAKGLIEFLAQAARAARKHRADPDEDKAYRDLARDVSEADADVSSAIRNAGQEMTDGAYAAAGTGGTDSGTGIAVDTSAVAVQITTEVTLTAEAGD
jgi:hypothetical protein